MAVHAFLSERTDAIIPVSLRYHGQGIGDRRFAARPFSHRDGGGEIVDHRLKLIGNGLCGNG